MIPASDQTVKQDVVYALARSADTVYAARASGLYRSQDEGRNWHYALASLEHPEPILVTAVATCENTIFAGVKGAVLRSDNNGESWHMSGLASPPPLVTALTCSPDFAQDGFIAAATAEDGIFISIDRGQRWTPWNFGLIDMNVYALDFTHDGVLFAGTESGIFRSRNGGRAWEEVDFPTDAAPVLSLGLSPTFARDGLMYAGTESSGLFRSGDAGASWQQVQSDFEGESINSIQFDVSQAPRIWFLLDSKLLMTVDGQQFTEPYPGHFPPESMATALLCPNASHAPLVGFAEGDVLPLSQG